MHSSARCTLAFTLSLLSLASVSATAQATRDAAYWPYAATSPWNTPIGSNAQYSAVSTSLWSTQSPGIIQYSIILTTALNDTEPVYIASPTDPVRNIRRSDGTLISTQRVPDSAVPNDGGDGWAQLIDENHRYVTEMYQATKLSSGDWQAGFPSHIDLQGSGISPDNATYIGSCAYGGSCIAGLIRTGEMANGIPHALRMSIDGSVLNINAPNGKQFVWPAVSADSNASSTYHGNSNVYMGTLLAIPASVDITKIPGVGTSGGAYQLAKALQDYGAYVSDRGYFNIYSDVAAGSEVQSALGPAYYAMQNIGLALQVVTNNGPSSVGGGGTPRRPLAPPFSSGSGGGGGSSSPAPVSGTTYTLVSGASTSGNQLCLDDYNYSTTSGTPVGTWYCNGQGNQKWTVNNAGNGYFTLVNQGSGLCLDDPGQSKTVGQYLWQYTCNGTVAQNWKFNSISGNTYNILNQAAGLSLDDPYGSASPQQVWLYTTNTSAAQYWTLNKQ